MHVIVCGDRDHLAQRAATHIAESVSAASGPVSLGLAGGSTPVPVYQLLAAAPLAWSDIVLWLGDERWVPADDPRSNSGMAAAALGERVPATFLPFPYDEEMGPVLAAAAYGREIESKTGLCQARVVLLGMGSDGHTASLFPGTDLLTATGVYAAGWIEELSAWRASATFDYLAAADELVFLVAGADKAETLARVVDLDEALPAGALAGAAAGEVTVLVDAAAASTISGRAS